MKKVIILLQAGKGLDRRDLEKIEGSTFDTQEELLDAIHPTGREMFLNNEIQVWTETDFMDAWNNTDDDSTEIEIMDTFLGYANIKFV
jgi:hypothetical protein